MISLAELREGLGMTQTDFAKLCGVSQAAIVGYEHGRRRPTGRAAEIYVAISAARIAPTMTEDVGRGRTVSYPIECWPAIVPIDADVALPQRLDWSPRGSPTWRLADRAVRQAFYALVLDEGNAVDVQVFLDPDELVRLADDLPVARSHRSAVARLVERLSAGHRAAA